MPTFSVIMLAVIVAAFLSFAAVLFWADRFTQHKN